MTMHPKSLNCLIWYAARNNFFQREVKFTFAIACKTAKLQKQTQDYWQLRRCSYCCVISAKHPPHYSSLPIQIKVTIGSSCILKWIAHTEYGGTTKSQSILDSVFQCIHLLASLTGGQTFSKHNLSKATVKSLRPHQNLCHAHLHISLGIASAPCH